MAFWKPGTARPGSSIDRSTENESSFDVGAAQNAAKIAGASSVGGIQSQRQRLPIFKHREELLYTVETYPVVIVVGQTGCGKTTQLPQYLLEAGWAPEGSGSCIACTQPRRISAVSVANRVAEEVGSVLGDEVGYTIRFEDLSHPTRTRLKYMTDGMLFRECMRDPLLSKYSVIMVDEAHERGAYTDLLLGLLKKIRRKRPSLRLIISSATLDAQGLVDFFQTPGEEGAESEACIVSLEGRAFPVEIAYMNTAPEDYVRAAVETVWSLHLSEPKGDVLVFLTGRDDIDTFLQMLADQSLTLPPGSPQMLLLPLHAGLTVEEQTAIFQPAGRSSRKIVAATNIAEASITIDGIAFVVDCGFVKLRSYNPRAGVEVLALVPESQASAVQRAGRAGRTAPGKCFRLYPESAFAQLAPATPPELARTDLSMPLLQLKALGISNLAKFDWLPPPPPSAMIVRSLDYLAALGAIDEHGRLTPGLGEQLAEMPTDPSIAKILIESTKFNCGSEILSISAMTCVSSPFIIPDEGRSRAGAEGELQRRKFTAEEGDHLTLLNVYNAFVNPRVGKQSAKWCANHRLNFKALSRAVSIRGQLQKYMKRFHLPIESCEGDHACVRKCLVTGLFRNAAKLQPDGTYRSAKEQAILHVHPSSVLFNRTPTTKWVIYHEVVETTKRFVRDVTVIDEDWLLELAPHFYEVKESSKAYGA